MTTVNLNVNIGSQTENKVKANEIKSLRDNIKDFSRCKCILLVDKIDLVKGVDAIVLVKWASILDFDPHSWETGLLARLKRHFQKRVYLKDVSWQEEISLSDTSLTWTGLMGISNQPQTMADLDYDAWRRKVFRCVECQVDQIKKFAEPHMFLNVVVIWPDESKKVEHFYSIIELLREKLNDSHVVVIVPSKRLRTDDEIDFLRILKRKKCVTTVELEVTDLCHVIRNDCKELKDASSEQHTYQLPSGIDPSESDIEEKDAMWLKEDLDILYLENMTGTSMSPEELQTAKESFLKGGTLPWAVRYGLSPVPFIIERDSMRNIIKFLTEKHIEEYKSGILHVLHHPCSGGTTLAQSILWHFRKDIPCIQIKHKYQSSIADIVEKIEWVYKCTSQPILIMIDGEEKHRVNEIYNSLQNYNYIIIIHVQRHFGQFKKSMMKDNTVCLSSILSKKEATALQFQYQEQCNTQAQIKSLKELEWQDSPRLVEFGLAVYSKKYEGLKKFVSTCLQIDPKKKMLQPWQDCLCYLALVYFYGQSSLPCYMFSDMLKKKIHEVEDFPDEMKELIVVDENDSRQNMVRVCNYYIAKEILEQLLTFPSQQESESSEFLSDHAKKQLERVAVNFIKFAASKVQRTGSVLAEVMIQTFISRSHSFGGDSDTMDMKRKPRCSPLIEHSDNKAPFTGRFNIMKQLCESFPGEAQIRAHLGRLYSICRPDEEDEAENHLQKALQMALSNDKTKEDYIDYRSKLDLSHIYHMFACFEAAKVYKVTGKGYNNIKRYVDYEEKCKCIIDDVTRACEWLYAIRHDRYPHDEEVEYVLQRVEMWHDMLKSPMSRFYMFVLKSLLGLGTNGSPGNQELLKEALVLKDDIVKQSKVFRKPKYPREWLGLPSKGIRRLLPGLSFFGKPSQKCNEVYCEKRKGTIIRPNTKPLCGYISLDLQSKSDCQVNVFFVPARANRGKGMVGLKYKEERVEFVIGFSLKHGFEAFSVNPLRKIECLDCEIEIEAFSNCSKVRCPKCKRNVEVSK